MVENRDDKVQILMTNDAERHIECFDLHICQCAIRCQVIDGRRFYEFLMTPACAEAVIQGHVHTTPLHRCSANEQRLATRLLKYTSRGLFAKLPDDEVLDMELPEPHVPPLSHLKRMWGGRRDHGAEDSYWIIKVKNKKFISSALLAPPGEIQTSIPSNCPTSEPAIYYPCTRRDGFNDLAYTNKAVHWLIRTHAGPSYPVSLLGGARVWSNALVPLYLTKNRALTQEDVVDKVRKELPRLDFDEEKGIERYVLRCPYPFTCLVCVIDWQYKTDSDYGPLWHGLLETTSPCTIETVMYCADTLMPCEFCRHANAAPLQIMKASTWQ